jgi:hypothetical protein
LIKSVKLFALSFAIILLPAAIRAAQEQEENDPVKAAALIREVIKMRGGDAYLKFRSVVSRGQYTIFEKGAPGNPISFADYIAFPNRERTDYGKGDNKYIKSNSELANWVYDGKQRMIRDQTDEQIKQFQQEARYDLDALLRAAAAQSGVKLVYLGRREPWRNTFSEAVRVDFTDGGSATLHIDARAKLPLSVEYKIVVEEGTVKSEMRYYRWVEFNGVQFPTLQDFYREGKQSGRVSFDSININESIPDKLFAKPASIKEVK